MIVGGVIYAMMRKDDYEDENTDMQMTHVNARM